MPPSQTAALPRDFETSFCLTSRPLIAHAVNGLDVGRAAVGFNLAANPADGGCQGVLDVYKRQYRDIISMLACDAVICFNSCSILSSC